ncbi:MAG: M48 family metallopeptidase [Candidatus Delongbacteria bacterium]|jgi:STE24 endopeptidase|nr:M48 family metallopeptidase [Candidatus Delongbacteria bacterium]
METPQIIFWIIIGILVADFIVGKIVSAKNYAWRDKKPSKYLSDVYDDDKYNTFQAYSKANYKIGTLTSSLMFILTLAVFFWEGFAWLDQFLSQYIESKIWLSIAFFAAIAVVTGIISLPFSIYDTFVIEERFGFNKTTPRTFIFDMLKNLLLSVVIGGVLLFLILQIYYATQTWFWLLAWIIISLFSIFMAEFYSTLIVPLFNKQKPLEEGELKEKISEFARRAGFQLDNVYVIDNSKRSTRANAYFTGLGKKKRIVLFDTLINDFTPDEIVGVLAHEIGHYKKHHIHKSLVLSLLNTGFVLFLFGLFVGRDAFSQALGAEEAKFHLGAIVFMVLYSPVSTATGMLMNKLSRNNEGEADDFAAQHGQSQALINALKKLARKNLSNLTPHPWHVFLNYSHPPLAERVKRLKENI